MKTKVLRVDSIEPEPECIAEAADVLRRGGLVAFPTETVYGLGAMAFEARAVAKIFAAKGRPPNNPLIVHVTGPPFDEASPELWPERAQRLAAQFWPGPLTLVLPKPCHVPDIVTAGRATWAVRMPDHRVTHALLMASGPLAAPSANVSTGVSPTTAEHVLQSLDGKIDLVLDGGSCPGGIESTVLDLTSSPPRVLRPGPIRASELRAVIGDVIVPELRFSEEEPALPSPGTSIRHYAPRATVECYGDEAEALSRTDQLARAGYQVWGVAADEVGYHGRQGIEFVAMPADSAGYAARLYDVLHEGDKKGVDYLIFGLPPADEAWVAVRDRLRRASTIWRDAAS